MKHDLWQVEHSKRKKIKPLLCDAA
jgi:hypothetical protein